MQVCVWMYIEMYWSLGGVRGPKAGNALQEVCVHEVGNRGGFVWARCWNYLYIDIYIFVFVFGVPGLCLDGNRPGCAWMWAAEGAWTPLTPPSSYHPKGGLIGIYVCTYTYL